MATKKSPKSKIVKEVERMMLQDNQGPLDDEFDETLGGRVDTPFRRKSETEVAIDEMLIGLDEGQGWYLKLSKEIGIEEWQLKQVIHHFKHVADLEKFVTELIIRQTAEEYKRTKYVRRWGSGRYRITFFNDSGMRGDKKPPVFFNVDAQEPDEVAPQASGMDQTVLELLKQNSVPSQDIMQQNIQALQKGMEIAANKDAKMAGNDNSMFALMMSMNQSNTQMMTGLLTALIPALSGRPSADGKDPVETLNNMLASMKNMGVLHTPVAPKPEKTLVEQITELKMLGLMKGDDAPEQTLERLKTFMTFANQFMGAGPEERPGIMEKLIDVIGPQVGKIMTAVTNVTEINKMKATQELINVQGGGGSGVITEDGQPVVMVPQDSRQVDMFAAERDVSTGPPSIPQRPVQQKPVTDDGGMTMYLAELRQAILSNDKGKYQKIVSILGNFFGGAENVVKQIQSGQLNADMMVKYLNSMDSAYANPQAQNAMRRYIAEFIDSFKPVTAKCDVCDATFDFENMNHWSRENANGEVICGHNECQGKLHLQ
jgi:hypothetical protein